MAESSFSVTVKKAAYIQKENPSSHVTAVAGTAYNVMGTRTTTKDNELLLVLNAAPDNLKRKRLLRMQLTMYLKRSNNSSIVGNCRIYPINDYSWNIDTVTYNTRPNLMTGREQYVFLHGDSQWIELTAPTESSNYDELYTGTAFHGGLCISAESTNNDSDDTKNWYARTDLANGSPAKLTAYYDTDVTVTSKASLVSPLNEAALSSLAASDFTWQFSKSGSYYCADERWRQSSATLYWKASDESSWHQINVSNARETEYTVTYYYTYTVPAYTFPCGKTISWYIVGTDRDGTTSTSATRTFTTNAATLSMTAFPSGSVIDSRSAQNFSWSITESGTSAAVTQASAKIYWKVSTASSYNHIDVSGNTKSKSVPGYTFPPGSTISWYLESTLANGQKLSTSAATFSTQAFAVTITSAPSGSNIDTRSAITFAWKLSNTSGDVTQTSAVFYWRVSGATNYNQVSVSGNTKKVVIPANTFPTGKSIQWYVSAVVQGGTTLSTSAATFNTVSTQITLDTYPSGSNVYTAAGIEFTWHFASNVGNYRQASAKLYWRISTSQAYTQVSVSGDTQNLTIPANTFPTGKTIQWYLEGTDIGGLTSTTSVMSFSTVSTQITPQSSPTSGYADPRYAITFQWYFASPGGAVPQMSATFYWREHGTENWTSVAASGSSEQVTIPANTFPVASSIDWYLAGTDIGGTSSTSEVYTFSTTASTAYAYPQAPIGLAEDTSKPLTMSWMLANADGTLPKKVTLQWKRPTDLNWTTIRQSTDPFTEWTVAANFFPVGEIEWRVIATNRDNVDGPAGMAAFISVHAPAAPVGVTATAVPLTTISWQGEGQEGYEILIDGESVKKAYGTESSWSPDFVLEDGLHEISVRIQGLYGLWSDFGVTTVSIENVVPEGWEDLAITGHFSVDAILTATGATALTAPTINWFRDGKRIAVTEGLRSYTDRYVLGEHSYRIEIWNSNGNYARSETITGTMNSYTSRIALFSGGDWIELKLSESSNNEQAFTYGRAYSLRHVLGAVYPVLEVSSFEDESGSYNCSFADVQCAKKFESLRGQPVIMKSRGGNVLIGALLNLERRYKEFFISYRFTIQAIDWEDFRHVYQND